jgi:hypothetical protein
MYVGIDAEWHPLVWMNLEAQGRLRTAFRSLSPFLFSSERLFSGYWLRMSIGFKEWALVCQELAAGRQSIILRKGGIAEGREGFRFLHADFLLFPTLFHEQVSKLRLPSETPLPQPAPGVHSLTHQVFVEWTRDLTDWTQIQRLAPFHIWTEQVIRERFEYEEKRAVSLAFVRVSRLSQPLVFPDAPRYGGCRSWVQIPELSPSDSLEPVLGEPAHKAVEAALLAALDRV